MRVHNDFFNAFGCCDTWYHSDCQVVKALKIGQFYLYFCIFQFLLAYYIMMEYRN